MVKTIRVSDEEYNKIIQARQELAKHGYNRLPQETKDDHDMGSFTLGAIVALGALALIYLLSKENGGSG